MYKEASYEEKFRDLAPLLPFIVKNIEKSLKSKHIKNDPSFLKTYSDVKDVNRISFDQLLEAYRKALTSGDERIATTIAQLWLMQNSDYYDFFATKLSEITPEFSDLEEINDIKAKEILQEATEEFGFAASYIFSVLNSVVFSKEVFDDLKSKSLQEFEEWEKAVEAKKTKPELTLDQIHDHYEQQLAKLADKYEKKLSGLQKKYQIDMEGFKKQIKQLSQKLQSK